MSKLSAKIKEEVVALIPPTLFFLFTLSLIALIRVLMLRGTGIPVSSMAQIAVGALILGKAVVIADLLPFINRYPERPLAYNIAWKTAIYTLVAMLVHYAGAPHRLLETGRRFHCRQREVACRNRVAPFLGHSDRPGDTHFWLLHHA